MKISLQEVPELDAYEDFTDLMWTDLDRFTRPGEAGKELELQADDRLAT